MTATSAGILSFLNGYAREKSERALGFVRAAVLFRGAEQGARLCATGHVQVSGAERMQLGSRLTFFGGMIPTVVRAGPQARLQIGDETGFNYGVFLEAQGTLSIGCRCMFASMVRISDVAADGTVKPIVIEDDVWVAHGAIIEPGVRIGRGSVVSAGSVVTRDVPPDSLAIGNPARCVALEMMAPGRAG